jgi:leader peptidase (prepilin peptidase) / N-methyltransferase
MTAFYVVVAGLVGACIGSFLNVVIWRLPRGESLVHPGSRCPKCGRPIRWFDNLPVLSWLALRGRCRGCRAPIAWRYPAVEALTAALFVLAALEFHDRPFAGAQIALLLAALVAVTYIDIDHRIIPDAITKPGMVVGLALSLVPPFQLHPPDWIHGFQPGLNGLLHSAAGILTGLGVVYGVRLVGGWIFKKEAMGLGDAKLLALIGAFTGPAGALYALTLGCLGGVFVHGAVVLVTRRRPKPLGLDLQGAGGQKFAFDRARVRPAAPTATTGVSPPAYLFDVVSPDAATPGATYRATAVLPKIRVLTDVDVTVTGRAVLEEVATDGGAERWRLRVEGLTAEDAEHLDYFANSHRYLPFGPYLALGGAAAALYGEFMHWLLTEWYPRWARGLFGG